MHRGRPHQSCHLPGELCHLPCLPACVQLDVFVRSCNLSEYRATEEQCRPVQPGYYNLDAGGPNMAPDVTTPTLCPSGAQCAAAAAVGSSLVSLWGFIVPEEGQWHSNMFSPQVGCVLACRCNLCGPVFVPPLCQFGTMLWWGGAATSAVCACSKLHLRQLDRLNGSCSCGCRGGRYPPRHQQLS